MYISKDCFRPLERVTSQMVGPCRTVLISGTGTFLARRLVDSTTRLQDAEVVPLSEQFNPQISEAACAFAVARLAIERLAGQS